MEKNLTEKVSGAHSRGQIKGREIAPSFLERFDATHPRMFSQTGRIVDLVKDIQQCYFGYGIERLKEINRLPVPADFTLGEKFAYLFGAFEAIKTYDLNQKYRTAQ